MSYAPFRCFWYDENGKSYERNGDKHGCITPRCKFVHPWDTEEWPRALPSRNLPPKHALSLKEERRLYGTIPTGPRIRRTQRSRTRSRSRDRVRIPGRGLPIVRSRRSRTRSRSRGRDRDRSKSRSRSRSSLNSPRVRFPGSSRRSQSPRRDDYRRHRRSPSHATTIRSSHSPPPHQVPITPDLPYDTPITSTPAPLTTERENTRLPPSEPHVMPNPAHPVKVEQEPTSTPPTTTSPTVEALQHLHISPTRTSSIAGLGSILATLKLQNSVPNMSTPTSTEPAPAPAPPTQPAPPVPTPPLPTNLTSPSSEVVLPTETQTISSAPEGSTSHLNEQRTMWDERVELLADVLQKREALVTLDASRAFYGRLAATVNSFDVVIERSRFKAESVGFGLKRMAKEKEYNEAMDKLLGSEAWRLLRLESANDAEANTAPKRLKTDGDAKKMLADIQATIVTVKDAVKELHGFVQDIGTKQNIAVPVPHGTSPILPAPNQDAEMEAASPKAQADTSLDQTNDEDVPRSLSGFYDGLKAVEDRLIDIESNLAQRQEEIGEEIQSDLESQFNDLKILVEEQAHNPILSQAKELCESNAKRVTTVEGDVSKTGYEIDELANEVVEAIGRTNEVVHGNEHLAQENAWLRHENERLQRTLEEMEHRQKAELALMRAETDEAKALLQEYLSRPPPPTMPPSDELLVSILPAVQQALHPLFAELHGVIQGLLTSKVTALNSSVQSTVHRLLHMISTFEEWADHVRDGVDPGYLLRRAPVQGPRQ